MIDSKDLLILKLFSFMTYVSLTDEEKRILNNHEDMPILERIKGMNSQELKSFDSYHPIDLTHYNKIQLEWVASEKYLIAHRPGHTGEVTPLELIQDMQINKNGERFRAFYVIKYPDRVKK